MSFSPRHDTRSRRTPLERLARFRAERNDCPNHAPEAARIG